MNKRVLLLVAVFLLLMGAVPAEWPAFAQETSKTTASEQRTPKAGPVYRLDFVVRDMEGNKQVNRRAYTMSVEEMHWGKIRVGSRVPYVTGVNQYQYSDVGVSIDCRPRQGDGGLLLETTFEFSGTLPPPAAASGGADSARKSNETTGGPPAAIFRKANFNGDALVTIGKPSVIATLDDVFSNRRYEVEVKATKVK